MALQGGPRHRETVPERFSEHADGSITVYERRLQVRRVIRPVRSPAYVRRIREPAQADQAPSSTLDESSVPQQRRP